jgi:DNA adenine methylase
MAEPILKCAGGKRQLLDTLSARLPETFDAYHQPFLGGGAFFFISNPTPGQSATRTRG